MVWVLVYGSYIQGCQIWVQAGNGIWQLLLWWCEWWYMGHTYTEVANLGARWSRFLTVTLMMVWVLVYGSNIPVRDCAEFIIIWSRSNSGAWNTPYAWPGLMFLFRPFSLFLMILSGAVLPKSTCAPPMSGHGPISMVEMCFKTYLQVGLLT